MEARADLLEWYRPRREAYPWRARPDPYRVLVSEVMLQQTQAARVAPAFRAFVARFPTVRALARAPRREVLRAWAGLGYNRRALALSEAARAIVRDHGGTVPRDPAILTALPGIGPYTAAAVASVAYGVPVPALDTNVRRVVARALLGREPDRVPARDLQDAAAGWLERGDPGAWNQALMDLGRDVCRPVPRCPACPLAGWCPSRGRAPTRASSHRQSRFLGSFRELRGRVVRALLTPPSLSLEGLARAVGAPLEVVIEAVAALAADGLVRAGPRARAGRPGGRVRLAD